MERKGKEEPSLGKRATVSPRTQTKCKQSPRVFQKRIIQISHSKQHIALYLPPPLPNLHLLVLYAPPSKSHPRDPNSDPFHFLFTKLNHVSLDRVPPRHATESAFAAPFDQPWQSPLGTQHDTLPMISTPEMIQLC